MLGLYKYNNGCVSEIVESAHFFMEDWDLHEIGEAEQRHFVCAGVCSSCVSAMNVH